MFEKLKSLTKKEQKDTKEVTQEENEKNSESFLDKVRNKFDNVDKQEEVRPVGKMGSYVRRIQLMNPISIFKRGYDIEIDMKEGESDAEKILLVKEKRLSKRIKFILLIMVLQSIPLSFAMTVLFLYLGLLM